MLPGEGTTHESEGNKIEVSTQMTSDNNKTEKSTSTKLSTSEKFTSDQITEEQTTEKEPVGTSYVLNTNTGKFHRPNCSTLGTMKDSNREDYYGTRDEVIGMGYSPCGRCNP